MKAAQLIEYGGQDAIKAQETDKPKPEAGQVLVEVSAFSVNPFDYKLREGYMKDMIPLDLPVTLGSDVAGTVAEIGADVSGFEIGQEVYGMANAAGGRGSYAEFTPVVEAQLVSKPKSVDFATAAALPLTAVSAYQALVEHINLQADQKILIHGGAGGIGSLAIQIAKNLGAYVATTARAADTDFVKGLGADEVIDYENQDFSAILKDYDAVFDTVGGETYDKSITILKPGGIIVGMATYQPNEELGKQYDVKQINQQTKATQDKLNAIAKLVDEGKLKVNIDKVFQFDQTAEALEYLKTGHPRGKVVIQVK